MHNQNILIASLNINGLNNRMKQLQLIDFMKYNKISILLIQEHNIRDKKVISSELGYRRAIPCTKKLKKIPHETYPPHSVH